MTHGDIFKLLGNWFISVNTPLSGMAEKKAANFTKLVPGVNGKIFPSILSEIAPYQQFLDSQSGVYVDAAKKVKQLALTAVTEANVLDVLQEIRFTAAGAKQINLLDGWLKDINALLAETAEKEQLIARGFGDKANTPQAREQIAARLKTETLPGIATKLNAKLGVMRENIAAFEKLLLPETAPKGTEIATQPEIEVTRSNGVKKEKYKTQPGVNADSMKAIRSTISQDVTADNVLKTLKSIMEAAAYAVKVPVRKYNIARAEKICREYELTKPYIEVPISGGKDEHATKPAYYKVVGGAEYGDTSVIIFAPPHMNITRESGEIQGGSSMMWAGHLLTMIIEHKNPQFPQYTLSIAPSLSGVFINGQQKVIFSARSSATNPAQVRKEGVGPVKNAHNILVESTTGEQTVANLSAVPGINAKAVQARAEIVQGLDVKLERILGNSPVIDAVSAQLPLKTAESLRAA